METISEMIADTTWRNLMNRRDGQAIADDY
jgi:hypothetical protein